MVATVALTRLDRVRLDKRTYVTPVVSEEDFTAIRRATAKALGLSGLKS